MKDLVWSHVLSVGNDEIDDDHHRLVKLFNMLNHSVTQGDRPEYLAAVLAELINCTAWHFSHEERLMIRHDYDGYAEHKNDHMDLLDAVLDLQEKILAEGSIVSDNDLEFLEAWLTEHILTADMRLGSYLAEKL